MLTEKDQKDLEKDLFKDWMLIQHFGYVIITSIIDVILFAAFVYLSIMVVFHSFDTKWLLGFIGFLLLYLLFRKMKRKQHFREFKNS